MPWIVTAYQKMINRYFFLVFLRRLPDGRRPDPHCQKTDYVLFFVGSHSMHGAVAPLIGLSWVMNPNIGT
ncbi:MAG: hypothetical protein V4724_08265 [Pseudomonadota bacterium]